MTTIARMMQVAADTGRSSKADKSALGRTTCTPEGILDAGRRARGEVEQPKPSGLALKIVNAGRAARGEQLL